VTAGGIPLVQVYVDDGTGTFPYDITTKTRVAGSVTRGRQDELTQVTPGQLGLILDNNDGRFTLGSTTIASPSPIKVDQKIRTKVTPGGNLIGSADAGSFESSVGGWAFNTLLGARTAGTSVAQSAVRATDGTQSLLATWSTTATGNFVGVAVTTVIGLTYTFAVDVYVPTGSPNVRASAAFIANSAFTSTKDAWVRLTVTFVATATTTTVGIDQVAATAGQTCFIDSAALNLGTTALPFAAGGLTVTRFTGYVQQWPVEWPSGSDLESTVSITAVDPQARGERRPLLSVIQEEIGLARPDFYYTMGEPTGAAAAADSSGNQAPSMGQWFTGTDVTFGTATGPGTDGLTAATFTNGGKWLRASGNWTPMWGTVSFNTTTITGGGALLLSVNPVLRSPDDWWSIGFDSSGHLFAENSFAQAIYTSKNVADGATHVASAILVPGTPGTILLFLDGVQVATASGTVLTPLGGGQMEIGNNYAETISHVAGGLLFGGLSTSAAVSGGTAATRFAAIAAASLTGFAGESGTARLTRTASYASLPVGTLDPSLTNVPFTDITGKSVSEALRQVADAEFGLVFFDGSGNLTFHNRNRVVSKTSPDLTLTADVLDPGTAFTVDMQGVLNYYQVTATRHERHAGRPQHAASETTHGRYPGSASYLVQTDAEALDRGNWIVYTHAEPSPRVGTLVIDVMVSRRRHAGVAARVRAGHLGPDHRPAVAGAGRHDRRPDRAGLRRQARRRLVADRFQRREQGRRRADAWILDNATYSVLDSTTRLYV
jgi:hypothetical protein